MIAARLWAELRLALAMLTRLPIGRIEPCPPAGAAAWAFPVAGVLPGLAWGLCLWGGGALGLSPLCAAFLGLAAAALTTGGLHEDGLADFVDGLSGGRTPERRLEIMRDSRIGSHGALALILATGVRAAAAAQPWAGATALALPLAAAVLSRALLPALMLALPPARSGGLGAQAARGLNARRAAGAGVIGLGLAAAVAGLSAAVAAALAAALGGAVVGRLARKRLGGQTGDVLGAAQMVAETAALVALAAVLPGRLPIG